MLFSGIPWSWKWFARIGESKIYFCNFLNFFFSFSTPIFYDSPLNFSPKTSVSEMPRLFSLIMELGKQFSNHANLGKLTSWRLSGTSVKFFNDFICGGLTKLSIFICPTSRLKASTCPENSNRKLYPIMIKVETFTLISCPSFIEVSHHQRLFLSLIFQTSKKIPK